MIKAQLERDRRARIKKSIDQLIELMASFSATEVGKLARMERADILELTVHYLTRLSFVTFSNQKQLKRENSSPLHDQSPHGILIL